MPARLLSNMPMTRPQQAEHNQLVVLSVIALMSQYRSIPSYKLIAAQLNTKEIQTSRGNAWTPQRLLRMLQRNGISGLWGLSRSVCR